MADAELSYEELSRKRQAGAAMAGRQAELEQQVQALPPEQREVRDAERSRLVSTAELRVCAGLPAAAGAGDRAAAGRTASCGRGGQHELGPAAALLQVAQTARRLTCLSRRSLECRGCLLQAGTPEPCSCLAQLRGSRRPCDRREREQRLSCQLRHTWATLGHQVKDLTSAWRLQESEALSRPGPSAPQQGPLAGRGQGGSLSPVMGADWNLLPLQPSWQQLCARTGGMKESQLWHSTLRVPAPGLGRSQTDTTTSGSCICSLLRF